jgi:hypothetical protein
LFRFRQEQFDCKAIRNCGQTVSQQLPDQFSEGFCSNLILQLRPFLPASCAMPSKFTMPVAGAKRCTEAGVPRPLKVPKANEITFEQGPKPRPYAGNLPLSAPVNVCLYKVTDQAGDVWDQFNGEDIALWQAQIDHPVRRNSITFQMRDGFNDYLRSAFGHESGLPSTVKDLETRGNIRLVVTDAKDPEDVGTSFVLGIRDGQWSGEAPFPHDHD